MNISFCLLGNASCTTTIHPGAKKGFVSVPVLNCIVILFSTLKLFLQFSKIMVIVFHLIVIFNTKILIYETSKTPVFIDCRTTKFKILHD
jgi:hypothetical protein